LQSGHKVETELKLPPLPSVSFLIYAAAAAAKPHRQQVDLSKVQIPNIDLSKLPPPPSVEQLIAALNALQNGDIISKSYLHLYGSTDSN
jgi:hypothetical protein